MSEESPQYLAALHDFRQARQRAILERIMARLTRQSADLLDYDEVREKLHAGKPIPRGLRNIPLDAIVGSVGRYTDFTRSFLPRRKDDERRWAEVKTALPDVQNFPPITVYQVGQAYFVLDGNHRVSIARQAGATHLPAYVTEIETKVPLSPDVQPDELIYQASHADFLEETRLDEERPSTDFSVTAPGQYRELMDQIITLQQWLAQEGGESLTLQEAAIRWYDDVYLPVIRLIRKQGILRHFPGRTETDLYAWVSRHRQELRDTLGWDVRVETATHDLAAHYSPTPQQVVIRVKERLVETLTPEPLEAGPAPGGWRHVHEQTDHLFRDILVPMSGRETGWRTFEQSLVVAKQEGAQLHGLHIRQDSSSAPLPSSLEERFHEQCTALSVTGDFSVEEGKIMAQILRRARWSDLIVYTIAHPPHERPLARLNSDFNTLIRQAACPVLVVPGAPAPLERALLAYDGSAKSKEALFVSAYLAGTWQIPLVVITVTEGERDADDILAHARNYLAARGVPATYVTGRGATVEEIEKAAGAHRCDFIIMGGYGFKPLLEVILGSTADEILRLRHWPVLICR
jgi:nucleotide-binding universal stress UspA family protein